MSNDPPPPGTQSGVLASPLKQPLSPDDLPKGTPIGRYMVIKRLGAGGMGVVYAAYDPELNRKVAIKLLHIRRMGGSADAEARARLLHEAQSMARLSDPHVISVFDVGTAFEQIFVAMEFLEGGTLTDWLAQPHSTDQILTLFHQAGLGLAAAHEKGLIHRDFKPDNVLLTTDGHPKVVDFGLAREFKGASDNQASAHKKLHSSAQDRLADLPAELREAIAQSQALSSPVTQHGAIMGTPRYMAPEQFNGLSTDERTDVFTFCVVLYEALYGMQAFPGSTLGQLAVSVLEGKLQQPTDRKGVPSYIHRMLLRGLAIAPEQRPSTLREILDVISPETKRVRRQRLWGAAALGAALVLTSGGLVGAKVYARGKAQKCAQADDAIERAWGKPVREQAAQAMLATKLPYAKEVWLGVATNLDRYLSRWKKAREAACEATYVRRKQPLIHLNRRLQCLDNELQEIGAFAEQLRSADGEILDRALEASVEFQPPSVCEDAIALLSEMPEDAAMRAQVEQIYREIGATRVLTSMGRFRQASAHATQTVASAITAGYKPAESRAHWQLGKIQANAAAYALSEQNFFQAAVTGIEGGDHRAAAAAFLELFRLSGKQNQQHELADHYHDLARAELSHLRAGRTKQGLEAQLQFYACQVNTVRGDLKQAEAACSQARQAMAKLVGEDRVHTSSLLSLANVYRRQGRFDEALTLFRQALEAIEKVVGREHPRTARAEVDLAELFAAQSKYPEAIEHAQRALGIFRKTFGDKSPKLYEVESLLVQWSLQQGQLDTALGIAREAFSLVRETPDVAQRADAHRLVGAVFFRQKRYEDALELHQKGLSGCSQKNCDPHLPLLLAAVADDLRELNRAKEGLPFAEQALRALPKTAEPQISAAVRFSAAQVLLATAKKKGDARTRAKELASSARETYQQLGRAGKNDLASVDAWLAKNRL